MHRLPTREALLPRLLSPTPLPPGAAPAAFDGDDWDAMLGILRQHRLRPLLHWQLTRADPDLPVSTAVRAELAASFRKSGERSLWPQRELVLIHRLLVEAGIPWKIRDGP